MPLRHTFPYLFLALACGAVYLGGTAPYLVPLVMLGAFVCFDSLLGPTVPTPGHPWAHRLLLWAYVPLQLAVMAFGTIQAKSGGIVAPALATGAVAGIFGMLTAHELIHSRKRWERALGTMMLIAVGYGHFRISHLQGHHRLAATRADPATARRGESAYRFLMRSISGQWRHAWKQAPREVLFYALCTVAIDLAAWILLGEAALAYLLLTSLVAILILELFDYVAHYGLERGIDQQGRPLPLSAAHSWNTGRCFNNWALFNGGHHSHHHDASTLAYENLRAVSGAPELPFGYAGCIAASLVPPLWRRLMDPRIDDYRRAALLG